MIFIDSDRYSIAGIETMFFPGGEPHVKLPKFEGLVVIYFKLRTWNDVGIAACILDALSANKDVQVHAGIMYFPGARQDKVKPEDKGKYPMTIKMMISLLWRSTIRYYVFDPHSDVLNTIWPDSNGPKILNMHHLVVPAPLNNVKGIIAPDNGAVVRATTFRNWFYPKAELLVCSKVRDAKTGELSEYYMPALPEEGRYIVVDDICDGGGTFNLLADAFNKDKYSFNSHLELVVSHGIFSKGLNNIDAKYTHITTTDSRCVDTREHFPRLTVLPLGNLLKFAVLLGST